MEALFGTTELMVAALAPDMRNAVHMTTGQKLEQMRFNLMLIS
jgi:hypothetical protein